MAHDIEAAIFVNDRVRTSHGSEAPDMSPLSKPAVSSAPQGRPVAGLMQAGLERVAVRQNPVDAGLL